MLNPVQIKIINKSENPLPAYATAGSSGMDIRAHIEKAITLIPMERKLFPTGLFMEIPMGYEVQIRPRSGLALRSGITCLNTPGTIDSDYRGEVQVLLINLSNEPQIIEPGERIAQMILTKSEQAELLPVQELSDSSRADGGFGHTGKK